MDDREDFCLSKSILKQASADLEVDLLQCEGHRNDTGFTFARESNKGIVSTRTIRGSVSCEQVVACDDVGHSDVTPLGEIKQLSGSLAVNAYHRLARHDKSFEPPKCRA